MVLLQGFLIRAQGGLVVGGIGTHTLADGQFDAQAVTQGSGQVHGIFIAFLAVGTGTAVAVQVDHSDDAVAVQVNAAELGALGAGNEVGIVVTVGITLRNPQGIDQQIGNVFHSFLAIDRHTVFHIIHPDGAQAALQQTHSGQTADHLLQQLIAVEFQNAGIVAGNGISVIGAAIRIDHIGIVRGTAHILLGRKIAGRRIKGILGGILLAGNGISAVGVEILVAIGCGVVADHPAVVADGRGVGTAGGTAVPCTIAGGVEHTEALIVTGGPVTAVAIALGAGGGSDLGGTVHVFGSLRTKGCSGGRTFEIAHVGQIQALAAGQLRQIQAGTCQTVYFRHIGILSTDHIVNIQHNILPSGVGIKVLGIDITGSSPGSRICQARVLPIAYNRAARSASGGIVVTLSPQAILVACRQAVSAVDQHQIVDLCRLGNLEFRGIINGPVLPELAQQDAAGAGGRQPHIGCAILLTLLGNPDGIHIK